MRTEVLIPSSPDFVEVGTSKYPKPPLSKADSSKFLLPPPPLDAEFQNEVAMKENLHHVPPSAILFPINSHMTNALSLKPRPRATLNKKDSENDFSLTTLLLIDASAAVLTSFAVAPTVAIIDKAIVAQAAGVERVSHSLSTGFRELLTRPVVFMRNPSVLLTAMVYAGTFGTANAVDTVCQKMNSPSALPKFFASSFVNLGLSLFKDRAFTVWYSGIKSRPVSPGTLGLFAFRDALTMAASFTLPPILANTLYTRFNKTNENAMTPAQAAFWAQILLPCAMQFVTTPVHLAAIDLYARPSGSVGQGELKSRAQFVFRDYSTNVTTRMFRILPAFGLGGNMNRELKYALKNSTVVVNVPMDMNFWPREAPVVTIGFL